MADPANKKNKFILPASAAEAGKMLAARGEAWRQIRFKSAGGATTDVKASQRLRKEMARLLTYLNFSVRNK